MYPRVSDFINDVFGTNIELPVQSYGFFLVIAFLTGAWLLYLELNRKEHEGLVRPTLRKVVRGAVPGTGEIVIVFVISLLLGYKLGGFITDYTLFANNPQSYVFSAKGSWWLGLGLSVIYTAYYYYSRLRKKLDEPITETITVPAREQALPILFIAVIAGIVGAKIFHWIENWQEFIADPVASLMSFSGLTFYGGLVVAYFACIWYAHKKGISWKHLSDAVAPSLILSYGIGRIGCQVAGDGDWGIENLAPKPDWLGFLPDWAWAYHFPHNIINQGVLIPGCTGPHCHQLANPVFPTSFYETLMAVVIFIVLWSLRKKLKTPGLLFSVYLMFNGVERFFIEKIRINNQFEYFGIKVTQAEIISTFIFLAGAALFAWFFVTHKKATANGY